MTDFKITDLDIETVPTPSGYVEVSVPTPSGYFSKRVSIEDVGTEIAPSGYIEKTTQFADVVDSEVLVDDSNGYGSTNVKIRRFSNVQSNYGSDITYLDSIVDGSSFTINTSGLYSIVYTDVFSAPSNIGISVNSTQLTTSIYQIIRADRLAEISTTDSAYTDTIGGTFRFESGDVVRAHCDGTSDSSGNEYRTSFRITRVGDGGANGYYTQDTGLLSVSMASDFVIGSSYETIKFDTVGWDKYDAYSTTTGLWTSPRDMKIRISGIVDFKAGTINYVRIRKNDSFTESQNGNAEAGVNFSKIIQVSAGETVSVQGYDYDVWGDTGDVRSYLQIEECVAGTIASTDELVEGDTVDPLTSFVRTYNDDTGREEKVSLDKLRGDVGNNNYVNLYLPVDQTSLSVGDSIDWVVETSKGDISHNDTTHITTLKGGRTYHLNCAMYGNYSISSGYFEYGWYDLTNSAYIGQYGINLNVQYGANIGSNPSNSVIVTPETDVEVEVRCFSQAGFNLIEHLRSHAEIMDITSNSGGGNFTKDTGLLSVYQDTNFTVTSGAWVNVLHNQVEWDKYDAYSSSTGYWTAPRDMKIKITATGRHSLAQGYVYLAKNHVDGVDDAFVLVRSQDASDVGLVVKTVEVLAGDTISVYLNGDTGTSYAGEQYCYLQIEECVAGTIASTDELVEGDAIDPTTAFVRTYNADTNREEKVSLDKLQSDLNGGLNIPQPISLNADMITSNNVTTGAIWQAHLIAGDQVTSCFHTDSSSPGAYIQVDLGEGNEREIVEWTYFVADATTATWDIQYSINGSDWSTVGTLGAITDAQWNTASWDSVGSKRYWRSYLTNTPGSGPWTGSLIMREPTLVGAIAGGTFTKDTGLLSVQLSSDYTITTGAYYVVPFDTIEWDTKNTYNTSTNLWTAPRDMKIRVSGRIRGTMGTLYGALYINDTADFSGRSDDSTATYSIDKIVSLSQGDTVEMRYYTTSGGSIYAAHSHFQIEECIAGTFDPTNLITGAVELENDEYICDGTENSVTIDVSTFDSDDLELMITARSQDSSDYDSLAMRFNADSGSNYDYIRTILLPDSTLNNSGADGVNKTSVTIGYARGANGASGNACGFNIFIPNYNSSLFTKSYYTKSSLVYSSESLIETSDVNGQWSSINPITSITFYTSSTSNFTAGSRFKVYGKQTNAYPVVEGNEITVMQKIREEDITSATTSIDWNGLDGDSDISYQVKANIENDGSGGHFYLQFNDDTTSSNYRRRYFSESSDGTSQTLNGAYICYCDATGKTSRADAYVVAKSGEIRSVKTTTMNSTNTSAIGSNEYNNAVWHNTADNITKISFVAEQTSGLGVGTHLELWAVRTVKIGGPSNIVETYEADTHAGYGSTNTVIPYYTNIPRNTINLLGNIENDSINGWSFTATRGCEMTISATVSTGAATTYDLGISRNSTALTTVTWAIPFGEIMAFCHTPNVNGGTANAVATVVLDAGDIIRVHTAGEAVSNNESLLRMTVRSL